MSTATMTPPRTEAQRFAALSRANEVRVHRSHLKDALKHDEGRMASEIVGAPGEYEQTMKVWDLLMAAPKVGAVRVRSILRRHDVSPVKTLGGLSPRQRSAIVGEMRDHETRRSARLARATA